MLTMSVCHGLCYCCRTAGVFAAADCTAFGDVQVGLRKHCSTDPEVIFLRCFWASDVSPKQVERGEKHTCRCMCCSTLDA